MIPKKIHYCWFGGNPLPENVKRCIDSWKKYCSEYEIIEWNENNYDVKKNGYLSKMYSEKKYAFVSDFARLDIIYNNGGIYLDTDVELIKNIDDLLQEQCFMGCELPGEVNTGVGFGANKGFRFLEENMEKYINDESAFDKTCVEITTAILKDKGIRKVADIQMIDNITVYPPEYFAPLNMLTNRLKITENTYSIHHYDSSWYVGNVKWKKKVLPYKIILRKIVDNIFGEGTYSRIKMLIRSTND
ncbi:glycosyltransferase family 32 protein [Streptococcus suis]|uniref:glycosyltransferase family 32 protein n=1 Tax=Streptococcus suis TaxID=1307 RepID=UPI0005CC9B98|nr:glycosyltransferase [Streptococcus suis]NQN98631.1 glycosyl transferase [Streptococcus suis]NQO02580.1 glycosyl transferase [Streptococcus suis]NQO08492.1 glycosyl transferase [Streptococcus suis]NQO14288.1 glycosyl transferase [Streptococcus suis]NQO16304.1 glycosyl transferase [Streptococcus suis]